MTQMTPARLTLRQLYYFIATAEAGSITLASERLNISPPSISTAIAQLEADLGAQLFLRRHAQGLFLTAAGQRILASARAVVEGAQNLYVVASEVQEQVRGTLSLGCLLTLAPLLLPEVSHSFAAAHPAVTIRPFVADQRRLLERLERAELDIALGYDLLVPDGFEFVPLVELPPYVQVGETDPLAARSAVTLTEMAERDFILLDLPLSRDYFLGLFAAEGLKPRIAAEIPHQDVIRTMVSNRYGYTIANVRPKNHAALDGRRIVPLRLAGSHRPMRIGLIRVAQSTPSRLLRAFTDHCRTLISDSYIPGMDAPILNLRRSL